MKVTYQIEIDIPEDEALEDSIEGVRDELTSILNNNRNLSFLKASVRTDPCFVSVSMPKAINDLMYEIHKYYAHLVDILDKVNMLFLFDECLEDLNLAMKSILAVNMTLIKISEKKPKTLQITNDNVDDLSTEMLHELSHQICDKKGVHMPFDCSTASKNTLLSWVKSQILSEEKDN
jgi:hypothetical protein